MILGLLKDFRAMYTRYHLFLTMECNYSPKVYFVFFTLLCFIIAWFTIPFLGSWESDTAGPKSTTYYHWYWHQPSSGPRNKIPCPSWVIFQNKEYREQKNIYHMKELFYFAMKNMCLPNSVASSEGGSSIAIDSCSSLSSSSEPKGGNKTENSLSLGARGWTIYTWWALP